MKHVTKTANARFILALVFLVAALGINTLRPNTAEAAYNVSFANFWMGKITPGSGHVGVDLWWPSGSGEYNPCHHSNDVFYGACVLANNAQASYYKVGTYTPTTSNFPYGIFIDNQNTNTCTSAPWCTNPSAPSFTHNWAKFLSDGSLEVYPYDGSGNYNPSGNTVGGLRIQTSFFTFANGGRYSPNIGDIHLPKIGESGVGRMNGFATYNGGAIANNRVTLEVFQKSATRFTSTGYATTGFTVVHSNSDGYYNTGALPSGSYKIYVTDTQTGHKIILDGVNIFQIYERLDFKLEQRCFGLPNSNCTDPA